MITRAEPTSNSFSPTSYAKNLLPLLRKIQPTAFRESIREFDDKVSNIEIIPAVISQQVTIPTDLPAQLISAIKDCGINNLYSHQAHSLQALRSGKDTMLVTPTASGKTLCYNPAILESCLSTPANCALYIFPLKALAADQLSKLRQLSKDLSPTNPIRIAMMTGDTPPSDRLKLFTPFYPQILMVSPDLLHHHLYKIKSPEWQAWRAFLLNLKHIVIDEAHTYIGVMGMHFANLIRRLLIAIEKLGGDPNQVQFVFSSATIGNPQELAQTLSHRSDSPERLEIIQESGAGSAEKTIITLQPSETVNVDSARVVCAWLRNKISGIVFCNSRSALKNLLFLLQKELEKLGQAYLAKKIVAYYGSILPERRREIIDKIQSGEIKVILSTSALESGLDLPELDACLVRGYPGSLMSFRQRIGRAGRHNPGMIIFLPLASAPLDNFYGQHPDQLIHGEVESASFNPDYPTIMSRHLECCAAESGLSYAHLDKHFGPMGRTVAKILQRQDRLQINKAGVLYARGYPHMEVRMRGNQLSSINVVDSSSGETLEEMSIDAAFREVFPGAYYSAQDESGQLNFYRSESLDIKENKAILSRLTEDPKLSTQAIVDINVNVHSPLSDQVDLKTTGSNGLVHLQLHWGKINVSVSGYALYQKFYGLSCNNVSCKNYQKPLKSAKCGLCGREGKHGIAMKELSQHTFPTAYQTSHCAPIITLQLNAEFSELLKREVEQTKQVLVKDYGKQIPEESRLYWQYSPTFLALHSLEHLINFALPMLVLSSSRDLSGLCIDQEEAGKTICYLFDSSDGGNGAAEALFERFNEFVEKAKALADNCDCAAGCPRCLYRHGCHHDNLGLDKDLGYLLLNSLSNI